MADEPKMPRRPYRTIVDERGVVAIVRVEGVDEEQYQKEFAAYCDALMETYPPEVQEEIRREQKEIRRKLANRKAMRK